MRYFYMTESTLKYGWEKDLREFRLKHRHYLYLLGQKEVLHSSMF